MAWNRISYDSVGADTFIVPPGVTQVVLFGYGAGGGGGGGGSGIGATGFRNTGGGGGGAAIPGWTRVSVTPGATISVTIPDGGFGGGGGDLSDGNPGTSGADTLFDNYGFSGGAGGTGGKYNAHLTNAEYRSGGPPFREVRNNFADTQLPLGFGWGGAGFNLTAARISSACYGKVVPGYIGATSSGSLAGAQGTDTGFSRMGGGGGGGGGGAFGALGGAGGDGGDGSDTTTGNDGSPGTAATIASGGGGGGGGGGGSADAPGYGVGGAGGKGGSGLLVVYWWT